LQLLVTITLLSNAHGADAGAAFTAISLTRSIRCAHEIFTMVETIQTSAEEPADVA
jgi:hypothetical protein